MARTIQSPGVEIKEYDLSENASPAIGTYIFTAGFADKGPTDEILQVTSPEEFEQIYGTPTTPAERYFYHSVTQQFNSQANVLVGRLPYGYENGEGFSTAKMYSVLAYPVQSVQSFKKGEIVDSSIAGVSAGFYTYKINDENYDVNYSVKLLHGTDKASYKILEGTTKIEVSGLGNVTSISKDGVIKYDYYLTADNIKDLNESITAICKDKSLNKYYEKGYTDIDTIEIDTVISCESSVSVSAISASIESAEVGDCIKTDNKTKFEDGNLYIIQQPLHFELTEQQYLDLQDGIKWKNDSGMFDGFEEIGKAGIVIVNKAQTTINDQYEGYYIGIADNMAMEPSSKYESLLSVQTVNGGNSYLEMPETRMNFTLSGDNSLSQVMEDSPSFSIYGSEFDDTLVVNVFKLRKSIYADSPLKLDANISESYTASVDYYRQIQSQNGGSPVSFFIEKKAEDSTDVQIMVNPYMSGKKSGKTWLGDDGKPTKKIRVAFSPKNTEFSNSSALKPTDQFDLKYASRYGMLYSSISALGDEGGENADALYALGVYQAKNSNTKVLGSIPNKLSRILSKVDNRDLFDLDITVEAGLGTIWSYYKEAQYQWLNAENVDAEVEKMSSNMDEYATIDESFKVPNAPYADSFTNGKEDPDYIEQFNQYKSKLAECNANSKYREFLAALACDFNDESDTIYATASAGNWFKTGQDSFDGNGGEDAEIIINYRTINNTFINFAQNDRKDHMHICDPLRFIFIQGANKKTLSDKSKNFSQHIYWPLRYQFMTANTSYAATYGNWAKVYDTASDNNIWIPMSGVLASIYANTDANFNCWYAPAGPDRGVISTISDLALSPALKQRDQLYKISINPIYQDPNMGFVVFGQKTLQSKPSSFDRINVRRLFLYLEKSTYNTIKWFLFRNNTYSTRTAIINTLDPIFRSVQNGEGVLDYRIICNESNNTPDVIDANELVVDCFIKATRTAEWIICNFYSTKTSTNFDELIK